MLFSSTHTNEILVTIFLVTFLGVNALFNAFFGFSLPLYLGVLPLSAGLAFFFPRAGLVAALITTLLFERFFTLQPLVIGENAYKLYPLDIILGAVLFSGLFLWLREGRGFLRLRAMDGWLISFFVFISALFFGMLLGERGVFLEVAFSTWKNYIFYGALIFFLGGAIRSKEDVLALVKLLWYGLLGASVFLFVGIVRGGGLWTEYTPLSTAGTRFLAFPHAFYFSLGLLVLLLSLPLWYEKVKKEQRLLLMLWTLILVAGIALSLMRHLWLGLTITLLVAIAFSPFIYGRVLFRYIGRFIFPLVSIFATFFVFLTIVPMSNTSLKFSQGLSVMQERFISIGNQYDESLAWRGKVWESTWVHFRINPLLGIGFGVSVPVELGDYHQFVEVRNMHNSWLALLVQTGVIGTLLFLGYLVTLLVAFWRLVLIDDTLRQARLALSGLVFFQALVFFSQPYLETNLLSLFFWLTLGIIRAIIEFGAKKDPSITSAIA